MIRGAWKALLSDRRLFLLGVVQVSCLIWNVPFLPNSAMLVKQRACVPGFPKCA